MKIIKQILPLVVLFSVVSLPLLAIEHAPAPVRSIEDVIAILNRVVDWFFTILMIVAVIFIFVAAVGYLTSGGKEDKIIKAQRQFIYAVVAIGIALVARGIEFIVRQLLGA